MVANVIHYFKGVTEVQVLLNSNSQPCLKTSVQSHKNKLQKNFSFLVFENFFKFRKIYYLLPQKRELNLSEKNLHLMFARILSWLFTVKQKQIKQNMVIFIMTYTILIRKQKNEGVALPVKRVQISFTYLTLAVLNHFWQPDF